MVKIWTQNLIKKYQIHCPKLRLLKEGRKNGQVKNKKRHGKMRVEGQPKPAAYIFAKSALDTFARILAE